MSDHTQGPWVTVQVMRHIRCFDVEDKDGNLVASVFHRLKEGEARANARLIAAAPDLFEALRGLKRGSCFCEMSNGNPMFHEHSPACQSVREALALAEGGAI